MAVWGRVPIVGGNLLWVAASVLLLPTGAVAPNAPGLAFLLAQARGIAALTVLEFRLSAIAGARS